MAVSCPQILWWLQTFWDLQELLCIPVWKQPSMPLTSTRERGFAFRMLIRHLWRREEKWKRPAPARRRAAAQVKVLIPLPLILTAKLHLQRHCSPAILPTAITQRPSSSSPTEWRRNGRNVTDDPSLLSFPQHMPGAVFCAFKNVSRWSHWNLPLREFFQENPIGYPCPKALDRERYCE